jgi:hypothetical protein
MFELKEFAVSLINPDNKDYERALGLSSDFDECVPSTTKASKMSKLIKDPHKLVRRAKAIVGVWGTDDYDGKGDTEENVWIPFRNALRDMGFSESQISDIANFEIDEENL